MALSAAELHRTAQRLPPLPAEDAARADCYALLARLLLHPPDSDLLNAIAAFGDAIAEPSAGAAQLSLEPGSIGTAWNRLSQASLAMDAVAAADEYSCLFFDIGSPQVNPYESRYLSGFMMEKPLARLRADLHALGLGRRPGTGELEDHLGALCETMRVMITGEVTGQRETLESQHAFFRRHIEPWWQRCLDDIRKAQGVNYYLRVADLAEAFLTVEQEAFDMAAATDASSGPDSLRD